MGLILFGLAVAIGYWLGERDERLRRAAKLDGIAETLESHYKDLRAADREFFEQQRAYGRDVVERERRRNDVLQEDLDDAEDALDRAWQHVEELIDDYDDLQAAQNRRLERRIRTERAQQADAQLLADWKLMLARKAHIRTLREAHQLAAAYHELYQRWNHALDERDMLAYRNTEGATTIAQLISVLEEREDQVVDLYNKTQEQERALVDAHTQLGKIDLDHLDEIQALEEALATSRGLVHNAQDQVQRALDELADERDSAEQAHIDRESYRSRVRQLTERVDDLDAALRVHDLEADLEMAAFQQQIIEANDRTDDWRLIAELAIDRADDAQSRLEVSEAARRITAGLAEQLRDRVADVQFDNALLRAEVLQAQSVEQPALFGPLPPHQTPLADL